LDYSKIFGNSVSPEDLQRAKASFWKKMREVVGLVPFARQAASLYFMMRDPKASLGVKATAVLALLYFISPIDMIPDFIPLSGYLDDAGVIATALSILGPVMAPYLKQADNWATRGKPLSDEEAEVVIDVDVKQAPAQS
jgi:uncharacterized membrane protein YkvA (DUF1232 family)